MIGVKKEIPIYSSKEYIFVLSFISIENIPNYLF
jgi:hypothetical protein